MLLRSAVPLGFVAAIGFVGGCVDTPQLAPAPMPATLAEGPLQAGDACADRSVPAWQLDTAARAVKLADETVAVQLPKTLLVEQTRPELLVLSGPRPAGNGPQPRYELIVAPHCEKPDPRPTLRRMAIRGLVHRYRAEQLGKLFDARAGWRAAVASKDGKETIVEEGDLLTSDAEVSLAVSVTSVARTDSYDVFVASACPRYEDPRRACQKALAALIGGVKITPPSTSTPVTSPTDATSPPTN